MAKIKENRNNNNTRDDNTHNIINRTRNDVVNDVIIINIKRKWGTNNNNIMDDKNISCKERKRNINCNNKKRGRL